MTRGGVKTVRLRVSAHATEEEERVRRALLEALPEDLRDKIRVEREEYAGHYGNPILVLTISVEREEDAQRVLSYILSRMSQVDRSMLAASLEERVDSEGTLYFRLSKQEAFQGRLSLYESDDVIRVSVSYKGKRKDAIEDYRRRLES